MKTVLSIEDESAIHKTFSDALKEENMGTRLESTGKSRAGQPLHTSGSVRSGSTRRCHRLGPGDHRSLRWAQAVRAARWARTIRAVRVARDVRVAGVVRVVRAQRSAA